MSHRVRTAAVAVLGVLVVGGVALALVGPPGSDDGAAGPSGDGPSASVTSGSTTSGSTGGAAGTTSVAFPTDAVEPAPGQEPVVDAPVEQTGGAVQVVLTYSGWDDGTRAVQAVGFVSGVVEAGGTCTLTLTQGGTVLSEAVEATPDASTTNCGEVSVSGPELTPGTWTAVLDYASGTSTGASDPVQIEVSAQ